MPELPEVECLSIAVRAVILGKRLVAAEFFRPNLRWPIPITEFKQRLVGRSILSVERRSKYLLIETAGGYAIIHLGMTGNIFHSSSSDPSWKHTHACWQFQDESGKIDYLYYVDPRRFGSILYCSHNDLVNHPLLKELGPEPLLTENLAQRLWDRSRGKSVAVKIFLMDAHHVVGVGNIYANEALFLASIHPARKVAEVSREEWQCLSQAIQSVLTAAIAAGGTSFRDYKHVDGEAGYFKVSLCVYGREGAPCLTCGLSLSLMKLGGRASYFCQSCQI